MTTTTEDQTTRQSIRAGDIMCVAQSCDKPATIAALLRHSIHPGSCKRPMWSPLCDKCYQDLEETLRRIAALSLVATPRCIARQTRVTPETILIRTRPL